QKVGNSTPFCSKIVSPVFQFAWATSRRSHSTSSYGCTPGVVKTRWIVRPDRRALGAPPRVVRLLPAEVSVIVFPLPGVRWPRGPLLVRWLCRAGGRRGRRRRLGGTSPGSPTYKRVTTICSATDMILRQIWWLVTRLPRKRR